MFDKTPKEAFGEVTNLRTVLTALGTVVGGIGCLSAAVVIGGQQPNEIAASVTQEFGSVLVATGVVVFLWDLWGRRAFAKELFAGIGLADNVRLAGLVNVTNEFYEDIPWTQMFKETKRLDVLFAYAQTWRQRYEPQLTELVRQPNVLMNIILPDRENTAIIAELAQRFRYTPEDMRDAIEKAEDFYKGLVHLAGTNGAKVHLWRLTVAPVYSVYRFDKVIVLSLYHHRAGRLNIPTLVLRESGSMYQFIASELDEMLQPGSGLASQVSE